MQNLPRLVSCVPDRGVLWFQLSTQQAGSLSVSIPVQFVKGRHVLLDSLDIRELLDSSP